MMNRNAASQNEINLLKAAQDNSNRISVTGADVDTATACVDQGWMTREGFGIVPGAHEIHYTYTLNLEGDHTINRYT